MMTEFQKEVAVVALLLAFLYAFSVCVETAHIEKATARAVSGKRQKEVKAATLREREKEAVKNGEPWMF